MRSRPADARRRAIVAFLLSSAAMLGVSIVKTKLVERWRVRRVARAEEVG
jgi:hypothetical protein